MDYTDLSFVLAGPGHTASTWLGHLLRATPKIWCTHEINHLTWTHKFSPLAPYFIGRNPDASVLGEHSNNYFSWDGIPEKLHKLNPRLKIVVVVRDPVKKVISNYLHDRKWGILPSYVPLTTAVLPQYFRWRYIHDSDYAPNLRRWLDWFPPSQIYLFRSPADIGPDEEHAVDLVRFLGGDLPGDFPGIINEGAVPFFPQWHRHARFGKDGMRRRLYRLLDPWNVRLGKTLGPPPYTEKDIAVVKETLGEGVTLAPLGKLAEELSIPGWRWLPNTFYS